MEQNRQILEIYSEKYLEGTLTPDEDQKLASMLSADRDLLEEFLTIINVDADLAEVMGKSADSSGMQAAVIERIAGKGKSGKISRAVVDRISAQEQRPRPSTRAHRIPKRRKKHSFLPWLAAAACIALVFIGYQMGLFNVRKETPHDQDTTADAGTPAKFIMIRGFSGSIQVKDGEKTRSVKSGDPVFDGETVTPADETGYELYFWSDSTVARFDPGSSARCIDGVEPVLEIGSGVLNAVIQKNGRTHPVFRTELADFTVTGTEFTLSVKPGCSNLMVIDGTVKVADRETGKTVSVAQGLSLTKTKGSEVYPVKLTMFETFQGGLGNGWMRDVQKGGKFTYSKIPQGYNTPGAMMLDYSQLEDKWGWAGRVKLPREVNWSEYDGIRFAFEGSGSGNRLEFEIHERSSQGGIEERFIYRFEDDTPGWRIIQAPFSNFTRRDFQDPGAPNDGFTRTRVCGWNILIYGEKNGSAKGWAKIDSIELYTIVK